MATPKHPTCGLAFLDSGPASNDNLLVAAYKWTPYLLNALRRLAMYFKIAIIEVNIKYLIAQLA